MQDDKVVEVVNTQAGRTLLLCERHVALVRSKSLAVRSTYKSMWVVPISEIKIVRGKPLVRHSPNSCNAPQVQKETICTQYPCACVVES